MPNRPENWQEQKRKRDTKNANTGEYGERREMWLKTDLVEYIMYRIPEAESSEAQPGDLYYATIKYRSNRPMTINLSDATEQELLLLRRFWNTAIDAALPVAALRDKVADDAFQAGSTTHQRLYRRLPVFVQRKGAEPEYVEGLPQRSRDIHDLDGSDRDPDESVRVPGAEVAEHLPQGTGGRISQDDRQKAYLAESVRPVGRVVSPGRVLGTNASEAYPAPDPGGDRRSDGDDLGGEELPPASTDLSDRPVWSPDQ